MSTATLTRPDRTGRTDRAGAPDGAGRTGRTGGPARSSAPEGRVRLTRRGRVVVVGLLVAVLLGVFAMGRGGTSQADAGGEPVAPLGVTTVHAGETLWGVARRIAPDNDARQVVAQIRELNSMADSSLVVGQQLLLPVAA